MQALAFNGRRRCGLANRAALRKDAFRSANHARKRWARLASVFSIQTANAHRDSRLESENRAVAYRVPTPTGLSFFKRKILLAQFLPFCTCMVEE
jgi:hypothetical protein